MGQSRSQTQGQSHPVSPSDTPHSSPGRSRKKIASKKIQNVWSTIKNFSPVRKIRSTHWTLKKRKLLEDGERLSVSHPDVSCSDLVGLSRPNKRSLDDMDALTLSKTRHTEALLNSVDEERDLNEPHLATSESGLLAQNLEVAQARQRLTRLRQYPFFQLEVHLHCGKNLLAKDSGGTSDPYVKFKVGAKVVYKSRTVSKCLDPKWDEYFLVAIEDVFQPVVLRAFDHDFGFQDDFLGTTSIDLTKLNLNVPSDLTLTLTENGIEDEESWGQIILTATLVPKSQEEKENFFGKGIKSLTSAGPSGETSASSKKLKTQQWDSVVNIILVEGKDLLAKDENGFSDPYAKFKLGNEKYKSKVISKSLCPQWNEQFDLHTFPDQSKVLEISVYDKDFHGKDDFMGKCAINLNGLAKEETHEIWKKLEEGEGSILLLVTISGTLGSETLSDLTSYAVNSRDKTALSQRYALLGSFKDLDDVGHLTVKVYKAEGLMAADFSGKSDPFCVVELVNARLQTNTEYKTLSPEWNKIFTFRAKDVHEVLELTVYDEDRDKKVEFLGKIAIPLLKIKSGEKRWYALKDKKLTCKTKGQIQLEMNLVYNPVRACIRTLNPKELKFVQPDQKFKRSIFVRNVTRVKSLVMEFIDIAKFINSCFLWESVPRSLSALILFLVITYFFELYMVPVTLLLIFLKNLLWFSIASYFNASVKEEEIDDIYDFLGDDDDDDKDGKSSLAENPSIHIALEALHELLFLVSSFLRFGQIDFNALQLQRLPQNASSFYFMETVDKLTTGMSGRSEEEEKKTLKEKFQTAQEVTAMVQNVLGEIASLGERVKNTFNFSVPFLSWLAVIALSLASVILYYLPLRYLVMAWGINKFTKKLRNPDAIANNEVMDFLSRVPDSDERVMQRELKVTQTSVNPPTVDVSKKGKKKAA